MCSLHLFVGEVWFFSTLGIHHEVISWGICCFLFVANLRWFMGSPPTQPEGEPNKRIAWGVNPATVGISISPFYKETFITCHVRCYIWAGHQISTNLQGLIMFFSPNLLDRYYLTSIFATKYHTQMLHVWYIYTYHEFNLNVGKCSIHGWYGLYFCISSGDS